jgi:hypothetical protein
MNNLPYFQPHNLLHVELSSVRLNAIVLGQQASDIKPGLGIRTSRTPGGTTLSVIKKRSPATTILCPFGEIISVELEGFTRGIRGGVCYCGDKNFNVPPKGINLDANGTWLVYLSVPCESQRDDAGEIFLPGIVTSSASAESLFAKTAWTEGTDYPDNTNPDVSDGLGTVIIPLGKLTIKKGGADFEKVGCGNVTINQCAGILSFSRA